MHPHRSVSIMSGAVQGVFFLMRVLLEYCDVKIENVYEDLTLHFLSVLSIWK
jgi:hypothetical protein